MSSGTATTLEEAIRKSGEGWIIDSYKPKQGAALDHIVRTLEDMDRLARLRLKASAPSLSAEAIVDEFGRNPARVRGFFQVLGGARTPEMLLMVWRIMQGLEIDEVQLSYRRQHEFHVRVVLASPSGDEDPPYESSNIDDFAIFRHIGVLQINNRPVFDGFYPLRTS